MHQTQISEKIPYGGFSQIRSHSAKCSTVDFVSLGMRGPGADPDPGPARHAPTAGHVSTYVRTITYDT